MSEGPSTIEALGFLALLLVIGFISTYFMTKKKKNNES